MPDKKDPQPGARGARSDSTSSSSSEEKRKTYCINQALFEALQSKGFSDNAIKKSIVAGCIDDSTCTQWITMHEGHPELDTPLEDGVEVVVKNKRILTEAEREAKVRELKEKAKAKVEEEKRLAVEKEKERIEMGKKAMETKEMLDQLRREAELAAVRKQKEEDAIARRRVKVQILTDKYERQGLSLEEARRKAELELEEGAQKKRSEATEVVAKDANKAGATLTSAGSWDVQNIVQQNVSLNTVFEKPVEPPSSLPRLVDEVCHFGDATVSRQCMEVLRTILTNIRDNPFDTSKRSLKTTTNVFRTKIFPVPSAIQLLRTCGFQLAEDMDHNESLMATVVVVRVIEQAIALLPTDV